MGILVHWAGRASPQVEMLARHSTRQRTDSCCRCSQMHSFPGVSTSSSYTLDSTRSYGKQREVATRQAGSSSAVRGRFRGLSGAFPDRLSTARCHVSLPPTSRVFRVSPGDRAGGSARGPGRVREMTCPLPRVSISLSPRSTLVTPSLVSTTVRHPRGGGEVSGIIGQG